MESKEIVTALSALAQESRLAIFRLLVQQGPDGLTVGRIGEAMGLAPATLSFHLKELARAGLLVARQEGRFIHYSANFQTMNAVLDFMTENCCAGVPCTPRTTCELPAAQAGGHTKRRNRNLSGESV